jgi:hypothetical protein
MNPLEHTRTSANIDFYVERGRPDNHLFVEVLTSALTKLDDKWKVRSRPIYYFTVYRLGVGEIASFKHQPTRPRKGRLGDRIVTRLVRENLTPA